jgi:hypothetical protein
MSRDMFRFPGPGVYGSDAPRLTKSLTIIDAAAAELGRLDLEGALRVLIVMAEKRDPGATAQSYAILPAEMPRCWTSRAGITPQSPPARLDPAGDRFRARVSWTPLSTPRVLKSGMTRAAGRSRRP